MYCAHLVSDSLSDAMSTTPSQDGQAAYIKTHQKATSPATGFCKDIDGNWLEHMQQMQRFHYLHLAAPKRDAQKSVAF